MGDILKKLSADFRLTEKDTLIMLQIQRFENIRNEATLDKLMFMLNISGHYSFINKVNKLVNMKLVEKNDGEDKRTYQYILSKLGREILQQRIRDWKVWGYDYNKSLNKLNNRAIKFKNILLEYDGVDT